MKKYFFISTMFFSFLTNGYQFDVAQINHLKEILREDNSEAAKFIIDFLQRSDRESSIKKLNEERNIEVEKFNNMGLYQIVKKDIENKYSPHLISEQLNQHGTHNEYFFKAIVDTLRGAGKVYEPSFGNPYNEELETIRSPLNTLSADTKHTYLRTLKNSEFLQDSLDTVLEDYDFLKDVSGFFMRSPNITKMMVASSHAQGRGDANYDKFVMNLDPTSGADVVVSLSNLEFWQALPKAHFSEIIDDSNTPALMEETSSAIKQELFNCLVVGGFLKVPGQPHRHNDKLYSDVGFAPGIEDEADGSTIFRKPR